MDNSWKWRAEYLPRSFVIVHTEHGQWQASFIQEMSAYLAEVSVTEQILRKFPNFQVILGELSMRKQWPGSFFSTHALEPGNKATSTSLTTDIFIRCHLHSIKVVSLLRYKQDDLTDTLPLNNHPLSPSSQTSYTCRHNFRWFKYSSRLLLEHVTCHAVKPI